MTLVIQSRPIINITDKDKSKWNAAFSPIIYTGKRADAIVNQVTESPTNSNINVNWQGLIHVLPTVGELIYLQSGPYDGAFKILSVSTSFIILDTPFITPSFGGLIQLNSSRENHHIELELYRIVQSSYVLVATSVFRTFPDGSFTFDVSSMIRRSIQFLNEYDYLTINKRVDKVSSGFNFRYKEKWQGNPGSFSNFDERDVTYYIGAAKQLRDKFGSNMGLFVPIVGNVGPFNGNFEISIPGADGWDHVEVGSISSISGCQLIYASGDEIGTSTWTSDTLLENGVDYEIVVDKHFIVGATVTIVAGTNEVQLGASANKEKILITANGTAFKIKIESVVAGSHQVQLNSVSIFLATSPQPAKFLTENFEPTYFKDFPFDLPFIHSDNLADFNINRERRFLDQNGVQISVASEQLDVSTNDFTVNRMIVGVPPPNTKCIEVFLEADQTERTGYVEAGYVGGKGEDAYASGTVIDNPTAENPQEVDKKGLIASVEPAGDEDEDTGDL